MRILAAIVLALIVALAAVAGYETWRVMDAREKTPALMAEALHNLDPQIARLGRARTEMLLKVEDPTFWTNDGIDLKTPGAGLTTLTQGLAKQLYFHPFKPGLQKIELMLFARFALTERASKQDILHAALARAYLGHDNQGPVTGFADAARHYYGRELSAITDDQYLSLVAMLIAPDKLDPLRYPSQNAERVARIKRLLDGQCAPIDLKDVTLERCAVSLASR
jgi:membrane carboxypeptidase/penicillin-binding protein